MKALLVAAVLLAPAAAHADQCQLLDDDVADRVRTIMAKPMRVAELCEPCGEKVPDLPFLPRTVEIGSELVIDGKARDLAYTYVKTASDKFENLALLAGCPVDDVSPSLRVDAETANGELISAGTEPVLRIADPEPEPVMAVLPPPPPPPPTYYSTTIIYSVPWIAIASVAGGAGFLLGIVGTLTALGLRRRRAMTPRATDLKA